MTATYDLNSKLLHNDAHAIFARMRADDPVHRGRLGKREVYFVTRYADVERVLKDREALVKDPTNSALGPAATRALPIPKVAEPFMLSMITSDDPAHRRLRKLVAKAFTPKTIAALRPSIEAKTAALCEGLVGRREVDLIEHFALPLPVHVITELVGVPESDRRRFGRWVHGITRNFTPWNMPFIVHGIWSFRRYVERLAEHKRGSASEDLLAKLVAVEDEGDRLSREELVAMAFLLLSAGHETTVSLIANGVLALAEHPQLWDELHRNPERLPSAIEELLRYDGPTLGTEFYYAKRDMALAGVEIPAGAAIMPMVLSANRDATVFDEPDTLRLDRDRNPHLAFGMGLHYCVGAPLARLEAEIALTALIRRFAVPRLAVPRDAIHYRNTLFLHRLERLPLVLEPRASS